MSHSPLSSLGRRIEPPPISWLMAAALNHPRLISLAAGFTDTATLPVREVSRLVSQLMSRARAGRAALQYGTTAGDPLLRQLTAARIRSQDAHPGDPSPWSPDRLLLTNGSQQMLYLLTEALCDPGDVVLVEDPTYFVYLGILQSQGISACGVRMEEDGLDLDHLQAVLQRLKREGRLARLKLLYSVSYHQNPSGTTTSFEKKAEILKLLRGFEPHAGHRLYFLEDAAYRELRFSGPEVKSALAAPGGSGRVLFTGTYSKPFATGIRVGFGLLPEPVFTAALRIKGNHDFGSSNFLQHLLAAALAGGEYERHLAALQRRYARKARLMAQALREQFPSEVEWREPGGGLYFWPRLPKGVKSGTGSRLFKTALKRDVLYVPGELCYAKDPARSRPNREMRLSFGAAAEADIREGIARLGNAIRAVDRVRR